MQSRWSSRPCHLHQACETCSFLCRSWYCSHWDCGECTHRGSISAGQRMIGADYHLHLHPRTHAVHRHLTRTHHREPAVPDSAVASSREWKPSGVSCGADVTPLCLRFVLGNSNLSFSGNHDGAAVVQAGVNGGSARLRQPRTAAGGSAGRWMQRRIVGGGKFNSVSSSKAQEPAGLQRSPFSFSMLFFLIYLRLGFVEHCSTSALRQLK